VAALKRKWLIEILAGVGLGFFAFMLISSGVREAFPMILVAGAVGLALYLNAQQKGLAASFSTGVATPAGVEFSFDEIGGQETAKREMLEALKFLKDLDEARRLGIRPLKGILLTGPPGTGKTLLARAAAAYTGSSFLAASGSEFVEMYAGVGARRIRNLFQRARELARSQGNRCAVIFLDEIEVLGGKRGRHASHLEYDQTLNQLLVEMDGLSWDDDVTIVVVAATNRPDLLDEALLRPGRFDRIVRVNLPDREGRRHILDLHCRDKPIGDDVDLDQIAEETFGFSGAHLASLVNEAAILAWREGSTVIKQGHFLEAVDKVLLGEKANRQTTWNEKRRIAVHEAGHALISELLMPGTVASATITARGDALGYVRRQQGEDMALYSQEELEAQVSIALAGHCAERLVLGSPSTGAMADFRQAVALVGQMVAAGMSPLGIVVPEQLPQETLFNVQRDLLSRLEAKVMGLLQEYRSFLDDLAAELLAKEHLTGDQLREVLAGLPAPAAPG